MLEDKTILVVAGIVYNEKGNFLICQRNLKKSQGGLWEFPGGKVEINESYEDALKRELKEELDMEIDNVKYFDQKVYDYSDKTIKLIVFKCLIVGEHYQVLEHEDHKWININDLDNYTFAGADQFFVKKLKGNL